MSDRAATYLTAAFVAGEADAVRAVYRRYGGLMYSVAYRVLGDSGLAEDATQQALVQAWRSAATVDPERTLGPWLATIARRAAIDVYRRERQHRGLADIASHESKLEVADPTDELPQVWIVREALDQLPEEEREVVRLQHFVDMSHTEIAAHLAIPVGTVKSRSFRAHRRLAQLLEPLHRPAVCRPIATTTLRGRT